MGAVVVSTEDGERFPVGPQGAKGASRAQPAWERGLSRLQGRAVVVLFLLAVLPGAVGWFWWVHQARATAAAQHQEQVAQQRAAAAIEAKICTGFAELAALKPPPGNPATNPSRAFDDREHTVLVGIGPDVGCRR